MLSIHPETFWHCSAPLLLLPSLSSSSNQLNCCYYFQLCAILLPLLQTSNYTRCSGRAGPKVVEVGKSCSVLVWLDLTDVTCVQLWHPILPYEAASHDHREQKEDNHAQRGPFHFHLAYWLFWVKVLVGKKHSW